MKSLPPKSIEFKYPGQKPEKTEIKDVAAVPGIIWDFMQQFFRRKINHKRGSLCAGGFEKTGYDAISFRNNKVKVICCFLKKRWQYN